MTISGCVQFYTKLTARSPQALCVQDLTKANETLGPLNFPVVSFLIEIQLLFFPSRFAPEKHILFLRYQLSTHRNKTTVNSKRGECQVETPSKNPKEVLVSCRGGEKESFVNKLVCINSGLGEAGIEVT